MKILDIDFYQRKDVLIISQELIGKVLCTRIDGALTKAIITETEAYEGITDKASHAYGNRRTSRTETMYASGGIAYVYLCYGVHHLFNVVTSIEDDPKAVLIRGVQPLEGEEVMRKRRKTKPQAKLTTKGPGTLSQALAITTSMDAMSLNSEQIWIEDHGYVAKSDDIVTGPRIGIEYAEEAKDWPYRFLYQKRFPTTS